MEHKMEGATMFAGAGAGAAMEWREY